MSFLFYRQCKTYKTKSLSLNNGCSKITRHQITTFFQTRYLVVCTYTITDMKIVLHCSSTGTDILILLRRTESIRRDNVSAYT